MAKRPAPSAPAAGSAPAGPAGTFNFKEVLQQLVQRNASDLHLKVGRPPTLRLHGELVPLDQPALKPEDLKSLAE
ncbi:MAG TPA: type IV pili twitching motility protein PilT, partial [Gemmatimonadaceae bacterium]|nr:type IV pili twitching motility protein PilT [Gemmatimonadaceae bacterium]